MSIQRLQNLPSRPIERNGVRHRPQAVKVILSVLARGEPASEIHVRLVRILLLVQSIWRCMPDIHDRALDGLSSPEVRDSAMHPRPIARLVDLIGDDACAHSKLGRVVAVEGPEDGS